MSEREAKFELDDPRLTAFALGELDGDEAEAVRAWVEKDEAASKAVAEIRGLAERLEGELDATSEGGLSADQRRTIEMQVLVGSEAQSGSWGKRVAGVLALAAAVLAAFGILGGLRPEDSGKLARSSVVENDGSMKALGYVGYGGDEQPRLSPEEIRALEALGYSDGPSHPRSKTATREDLSALGYAGSNEPAPVSPGSVTTGSEGFFLGHSERRARRESYYDNRGSIHNEGYAKIDENDFIRVATDPLSTFSIDVDTASYANVRRFLVTESRLPPADAVRIEELINYFPYDYPEPTRGQPFSVHVETTSAPWKPAHRLVKIGLQGRAVSYGEREGSNLVFLLDVSGSMKRPKKLPLLVEAMSMLVENLDPTDRVAITTYAGVSGVVLDSTACADKPRILEALRGLRASGSTNGESGIHLAYDIARSNFIEGGVNRVILATDGDFNVGTSNTDELERLIEDKAKSGVFLSVLGFGTGNLKDEKMETLADKGNGNYAYIDSKLEARKVLVEQAGGTLVTIAKDVKIQVEFNPAKVEAYRLIGYENRKLEHQDFNDDTKDAGEIGSGHNVTALYEVVPRGVKLDRGSVDPLRYQNETPAPPVPDNGSDELLNVKLRYKEPAGHKSRLIEHPVRDSGTSIEAASVDLRFAAAVAGFGMLLRDSVHKGEANWTEIIRLAREGQGPDPGGYRAEFQVLVHRARALAGN